MNSKHYDSDLTGAEFAILEPLLPARKAKGRPRSVALREILDAIFYVLRGGVPRRMLPDGFPCWKTVFYYFRRWRLSGLWEAINADRLARRHAHQALLMEEFRRAGVEVVFLNRPIGGTAEDDLLLQMQGVIAEYERAKILERSRRGRRHAARAGLLSAFTTAPFGYRYVPKDQGGGVARFDVVPEEARFARLIFAWVGLERLSLREVCRRLQRAGVPNRRGNGLWYASTLHGMLSNTAYIGRAVYGHSRYLPSRPRLRPLRGHPQPPKRPGMRVAVPREEWIEVPVPALVDPAVFEAAQAQLAENR